MTKSSQENVQRAVPGPEATSCAVDSDCVCGNLGGIMGNCFVGNKNSTVAGYCGTPDYCEGIMRDLLPACVNGTCKLVKKQVSTPTTLPPVAS